MFVEEYKGNGLTRLVTAAAYEAYQAARMARFQAAFRKGA
jgi:hypothetical protein